MPYEVDHSATYKLVYRPDGGGPPVAIRCKGCGLVSYHPEDVRQRFCGFCHTFHNEIPVSKVLHWVEERQKSAEVIELKRKQAEVR